MARCRADAPGRGGRCVIAQVQEFIFRAEAQRGRAGDFRRDDVRLKADMVKNSGDVEPGQHR